jgi:peptide deformylase
VIARYSQDTLVGTEACLSIPGLMGDVERPEAITVKGYNRRGQPVSIKAKGWLARIFQHEIDHLDGVLYIDRADKVWRTEEKVSQVAPAD